MYTTDEIAYSKSASKLACGITNYTNEVGVVTQSLHVADIMVVVDAELAAGTVEIDFDCLPRWKRLTTPRPKVSHDRQGNLRIYHGMMQGSPDKANTLSPGLHHTQPRSGVWLAMSLTITIAPDVRYVNL